MTGNLRTRGSEADVNRANLHTVAHKFYCVLKLHSCKPCCPSSALSSRLRPRASTSVGFQPRQPIRHLHWPARGRGYATCPASGEKKCKAAENSHRNAPRRPEYTAIDSSNPSLLSARDQHSPNRGGDQEMPRREGRFVLHVSRGGVERLRIDRRFRLHQHSVEFHKRLTNVRPLHDPGERSFHALHFPFQDKEPSTRLAARSASPTLPATLSLPP